MWPEVYTQVEYLLIYIFIFTDRVFTIKNHDFI